MDQGHDYLSLSTPRPTTAATSRSGSSSSRTRSLGSKCDCGRQLAVSKYCLTHQVVCCAECCFDRHRDGCDVKHLKEVVKDVKLSAAAEQNLIKKLDAQRKQRQNDLQKLLRQKEQMGSSVNKVYDNMKKVLTQLQEEDIKYGESKFREFDETIKSDIEDCTKAIDALKAVNKNPQIDEHFIKVKQAEKLAMQLDETMGTESLEYLEQDSARDNIKGMKFGYFLGDLCIDLADYGKFTVPADRAADNASIHAMCEMPDGTLLVATSILVKLDKDYKPVSETDIPGLPFDMCYAGNGKVAMVLKSWKYEGLLQVIRVPTETQTEINVGLQKDPVISFGAFIGKRIAYLEKVFIQDQKDVFTCDLKGKNVTSFYKGSVVDGMIDLAVEHTKKQIYIVDQAKGIVILNTEGKVLVTVSDPDLKDLGSLCVDRTGQIFVACSTAKRILLFNRKGQKQGVAKCMKKIGDPYCVRMQHKFNRLLISQRDNCDLLVYSLPSPEFYREPTHQ